MRRTFTLFVLLSVSALVVAGSAFAQTDVTTSRIVGVVKDASGGPLPGVGLEAKSNDTGFTVTSISDAQGQYRLVNLPTGSYTVTAKLSGFKTAQRTVRVLLGSAPTVDFALELSGVAETLTVTADVPAIESSNTASSTTIQSEQVKALPISNRNFTDLVLLTPSTRRESERGTLALSGQRGLMTNVTVDGVDFNNPFFGGTVGGAEGRSPLSVSEESIKEMAVITNGASVEFGRSGGGFVNVITKSGTNAFHGSALFYWQPQELISNFADGREPADQDRKQYGLSLGGPIMKDRLFFFGSYERLKQSINIPASSGLLDPDIAAKYPVLAPDPSFNQDITNPIAFGRVDAQIGEGHRVTLRANYTNLDALNGTNNSQNRSQDNNGIEGLFSRNYVAQYSGQFGSNFLNDLNLGYVDEDTPRAEKPESANLTEVRFTTFTYGGVSFLPINSKVERKQVADTVTYLLKDHVMKAGFDYNDTGVSQTFKGNWRGVFRFDTKADFLAGRWAQYFQFGGLNGLTADQAGTVDFGQKETAFFVQDQWFVSPSLTVSLGVRYERLDNPDDPILNPNDVKNDGSCLGAVKNGCFGLTGQIPDENNQWSPRLGITWSPDAKSIVRLALGRFWSRTPALLWAQLYTSNGLKGTQYTINAPSSGGVLSAPTDPLSPGWGAAFNPEGVQKIDFTSPAVNAALRQPGVFYVDPNFRNPYTDRITLNLEREVARATTLGLDLTYAKSKQLQRLTDINLVYAKNADGTTRISAVNGQPVYSSTRPYTYYGRITTSVSDAESKYYAATFRAQRRFADNFAMYAFLTWSQDQDHDSNERNFAGIQAEDVNNLDGSYGYSNRDQKWRSGLNGVWTTPWWGIGFAGSVIFNTGSTYNITTGSDENSDGFTNDRPTIDGVHFARNAGRQPSFYSVSLRLSKAFTLGPGELSVFGECFNCTNTGNKFVTSTTWGRAQTPSATYGLSNGVGTPRTIQVAARYDF